MRRHVALVLLGAFLLGGQSAPPPDRFDTVVIDPGHGGEDRGARGPAGHREKDVVLAVALRLAERLRADGLHVVLTRTADRSVSLEERTRVANQARGDLFLSIHANAAHSRRVRGIETFFVSLEASDEAAGELALRENEALAAAGVAAAEPGDPLATILGDLIATEHMHESNELARLVQKSLAPPEAAPSRGVKQAPFVVLMGVAMPASLVEIGFITHPQEERMLASSRGQEDVADALARAVREFGRRYDARRGVGAASVVAGGGGG